ncbi:MAG TPA: glycosyltransferase family 2 protein [Pirellulales bacterium]|jgi:cellulose synthase/poly-beta-1,6-N-acetylglucosamine synthase-like glycosyltransferase
MTLVQYLYLAFFLLPAVVVATYHLFLMLARLAGGRAYAEASRNPTHTFAIVIPAHNEQDIIEHALRSCSELDYPADKYRVFVVADNCTDDTTGIATSLGACCLERKDAERQGKGFALEWAFHQILPSAYDAMVVLDADCVIERHSLRVFDYCLEQGDLALQANHIPSNPDASPISYMAMVGNILEYDYFYAPKSTLGLAVMLVGTGMVLHRTLLQDHPWNVHSAVEDAEYTLILARHDIHVRFIANASVVVAAAERREQLSVQRKRWAGGALRLGRESAAALLVRGILTRRMHLADAGFTLLIVSRPLVLVHVALTVGIGALLQAVYPDAVHESFAAIGVGVLAAYFVYFSVGVAVVGLSMRRARYLLWTPFILLRLMFIALQSGMSATTPWTRTPR